MKLVDCTNTPPYTSRHGWKSPNGWPTSFVEDSAWVGGSARVTGSAQVGDSAWVGGSARVTGSAWVSGSAEVGDSAWVGGSAEVGGSARVGDSAWVGGSAQVTGSAQVGGDGDIQKTTDYICVGPIGSRNAYLTLHKDRKIGLRINTGCFSGSVSEFMAKLTDSPKHDGYKAILPALLAVMKRRGVEPIEAAQAAKEGKK